MTKLEFLDKINDILVGLNTLESDLLGNLYDELMRDAGWHPASELPPKDGKYIVISLPDMYGDTDIFYAEYRQLQGWCYEIEGHYAKINIQKWCYPPNED